MDPDPEQIRLAAQTGADRIELYTETYASAFARGEDVDAVFEQFYRAAETALEVDLGVNAGHDLNLDNLGDLLRAIPWIDEVSIGHAITADALKWGMAETVRRYTRLISISTKERRPQTG